MWPAAARPHLGGEVAVDENQPVGGEGQPRARELVGVIDRSGLDGQTRIDPLLSDRERDAHRELAASDEHRPAERSNERDADAAKD